MHFHATIGVARIFWTSCWWSQVQTTGWTIVVSVKIVWIAIVLAFTTMFLQLVFT